MNVSSTVAIAADRSTGAFTRGWGAVLLAASLFALAVFSVSGLLSLPEAWARPEYSHGYLIPFIALYLLMRRVESQTENGVVPLRWPGLVLLVLAMALILLGNLTWIPDIVTYGFILGLFALILTALGVRRGWHYWVPVAYLVFMLPLPNFVYLQLSIQLQHISSIIGVWIIRLFGIPVLLEGNVIDLGVYKLQVAEACSGLRYLFPLTSFGFLFAALYRGPAWHKVILFLSAAPITVLMNSVRIGIIGVMVDRYGIEQAEGFLHLFEGWIIFAACIVLMFLLVLLLQRLTRNPLPVAETLELEMVSPAKQAAALASIPASPALIGATVLLVAAAAIWTATPTPEFKRVEREPFASFPINIGPWQGSTDSLASNVEEVLGADDYFMASFDRGTSEPPVNLFMAYYHRMTGGTGIHSPEVCLPVGGWEVSRWQQVTVQPNADVAPFAVNRAIIQQGLSRQLVYYWFEQHGRRTTSSYASKFYSIVDSLQRGRTDAGLVRLVTPIDPDEPESAADDRLQAMLGDMFGQLADFIPE